MNRRGFLKGTSILAALGIGAKSAQGRVWTHNWDKYDFGSGPPVTDRLYQGPFPQFPPDALIPETTMVMTTTPSEDVIPHYGKGFTTYITADMGINEIEDDNKIKGIEDLCRFPLGQQLYLRPAWRDVQPRRGRLDFPDYWKQTFDLAKELGKRVAIAIQLSAPDYGKIPATPEFVMEKVPMVRLPGTWDRVGPEFKEPSYHHPFYQEAFKEFVGLMAEEFNGNPMIEYFDLIIYGHWSEGHTWPFTGNPFPDYETAERTMMTMMEVQLEAFNKTPLLMNTQPDLSNVGNSALLDRCVRSHNWIRSDTIFIEPEQIEALSNRPPWVAVALEQPLHPGPIPVNEGITEADDIMMHVRDIGANYWSLWTFHHQKASYLIDYYKQYPKYFDKFARMIGFRIRPSMIWTYEKDGYLGMIVGFANDGIAGVPGVLRVTVESPEGKKLASGCLDPGYPLPGKIRQGQFILPTGTKWQGLKLRAELEIKGNRRPIPWACHQKTEADGSLSLRPNGRHLS